MEFGFNSGQNLICSDSSVKTFIQGDLAQITLSLVFSPPSQPEGQFFFKLPKDSTISSLIIRSGQTTIQTKVIEKQQAVQQYSDAISSGHSAFMGTQQDQFFLFNVGSLQLDQPITVQLVFVVICEYYKQESSWVFSLQLPYDSHWQTSIKMNSAIRIIQQFHHRISGEQNFLTLETNIRVKSENIRYTCQEPHKPVVIVQTDPRTSVKAAYISYYPIQEFLDMTEWDPSGEFFILLDRSGSMSGHRIELAKEAVVLFLQSLPPDSKFNIYSFGSNYYKMFQSSQPYNKDSINSAIESINRMRADLGGTEIYPPLQDILFTPTEAHFPRYVFLVTDGDVSNKNQVIKLIREKSGLTKVSTIGIGRDSDPQLISGAAQAGNGHSVRIFSNEKIKEAVITALKYTFKPGFTDISVDNRENFELVGPSLPFYSFSGNRMHIGVVLNQRSRSVNLKYKDERTGEYALHQLNLDQNERQCCAALVMTIGKVLQEKTKDQATLISIKYQVLCGFTALLGTKNIRRRMLHQAMNYDPFSQVKLQKLCSYIQYDSLFDMDIVQKRNSIPPPPGSCRPPPPGSCKPSPPSIMDSHFTPPPPPPSLSGMGNSFPPPPPVPTGMGNMFTPPQPTGMGNKFTPTQPIGMSNMIPPPPPSLSGMDNSFPPPPPPLKGMGNMFPSSPPVPTMFTPPQRPGMGNKFTPTQPIGMSNMIPSTTEMGNKYSPSLHNLNSPGISAPIPASQGIDIFNQNSSVISSLQLNSDVPQMNQFGTIQNPINAIFKQDSLDFIDNFAFPQQNLSQNKQGIDPFIFEELQSTATFSQRNINLFDSHKTNQFQEKKQIDFFSDYLPQKQTEIKQTSNLSDLFSDQSLSESYKAQQFTFKPVLQSRDLESLLKTIISLQEIDGRWENSDILQSLISNISGQPVNIIGMSAVDITKTVIDLIKRYFQNKLGELEMIIVKAERYLKRNKQ